MPYTKAVLKQRLYSPTSLYRPLIAFMLMETPDFLRQQIVKCYMAKSAEEFQNAAIDSWDRIATQIIAVVGEGGFNSLFARSVFLTEYTFPWLAAVLLSPQDDYRFAKLKMSFEGQTLEDAKASNSLLLITFTDIMASLIGEHLTIRLMRSAWGEDPSEKPGKELQNE